MEGVAGVVHGTQTATRGSEYELARKLLTAEVNAAIEGALASGATEVLINDGHGAMRNLLLEELNPAAEIISGRPKALGQVEGATREHDGAIFIGYHAAVTTKAAIMEHTISGSLIREVYLNDKLMGETGLNASLLGELGVPVIMVSGDDKVTAEARELLGNVETAVVKYGITRTCARSLHPKKARQLIKEKTIQAIKRINEFKPFTISPPIRGRIRFTSALMADVAESVPGVERVDGVAVSFTSENMMQAYRLLCILIALAAQAKLEQEGRG
jgi:D-amino peptidase